MGNNQSVRATHFSRSEDATDPLEDDSLEKHHINISNKMVERLVEDATLVAGRDTGASNPKGDYKEKILIEKLRCMDDSHSERSGMVNTLGTPILHHWGMTLKDCFRLTEDELKALMTRVEMRTASMVTPEPVCEDVKDKIIDCYNLSHPDEIIKCWDTIGEFSQCVQDAGTKRLHARNEKDALETARRSRHVARAREHALKELSSDDEQKRKL